MMRWWNGQKKRQATERLHKRNRVKYLRINEDNHDEFAKMVTAQKKCQELANELQESRGAHAEDYLEAENMGEQRVIQAIIVKLKNYQNYPGLTQNNKGNIDRILRVIEQDLQKERNNRLWIIERNGTSIRDELQTLELELGIQYE